MTAFTSPRGQELGFTGAPLRGAYYQFFANRTSNPLTVYRSPVYSPDTAARPHPIKIELDAYGRAPQIFVAPDSGKYQVTLYDADGRELYSDYDLDSGTTSANGNAGPAIVYRAGSGQIDAIDFGSIIEASASSADVVLSLPDATTLTPNVPIRFRQIGLGASIVVRATGIDRIDDHSSVIITDPYTSLEVTPTGSTYKVTSRDGARPTVVPVVSNTLTTPPATAVTGTYYLAADAATSPWIGGHIYQADGIGGFFHHAPVIGDVVVLPTLSIRGSAQMQVYSVGGWHLIGTAIQTAALLSYEAPVGALGPTMTFDTWTTILLNTVRSNTLPGATLSGGAMSLPVGEYSIRATAAFTSTNRVALRVFSTTTGAQKRSVPAPVGGQVVLCDDIVTTGTEQIVLQYWSPTSSPQVAGRLGIPLGAGLPETVATLEITARTLS